MSIENVVIWYEKNVNYRLTKTFLNFLIKLGILKEDVDLEVLNLYLLEKEDDKFVKSDGKYKIKKNRIPVIDNFPDEAPKKQPINVLTKKSSKTNSQNKKFKIEKLDGKRLKLVKL